MFHVQTRGSGPQILAWKTYNWAVKRHLLHSIGLAFLLASPIWLTMPKPPKYLNCALSAAIGILLLVLRAGIPEEKPGQRRR